jgi:hypothetical protein
VPAWAQPATRRGVVPLRPLTVGEILDGAVTTIRRYPGALLGLGAAAAVVSALVQLLQLQGTSDASSAMLTLLGYLVTAFIGVALSGAAAIVLRAALLGDPMSAAEVIARTRERLWRLLLTALLVTFITVALIVTVVGWIWAYAALSLAGAVVAIEGAGPREAMRRSRALVKGAWWRTFGILVLQNVISTVVTTVIAVPAVIVVGAGGLFDSTVSTISTSGQITLAVATAVGTLITAPFGACVRALLYTDRRMRVEGLDVALQQSLAERSEQ